MCEFCDYYHSSKGGTSGKIIKISKCANETDLTDCQLVKGGDDDSFGLVIYRYGLAKGYFDVNYCPFCGKELRKQNV